MRAVYVVQAGSYSDRHIIGVCSTQELADRLVELYTDLGESPYYYVWTLDEVPSCPPGLLPWRVIMDRRGGADVQRKSIDRFDNRSDYYGADNKMYFQMFAEDENHAIKIANERRIMLIAANVWLPHKVDEKALRHWKKENER